jgi:hypothetical protein
MTRKKIPWKSLLEEEGKNSIIKKLWMRKKRRKKGCIFWMKKSIGIKGNLEERIKGRVRKSKEIDLMTKTMDMDEGLLNDL